jgi:hypothetical protein
MVTRRAFGGVAFGGAGRLRSAVRAIARREQPWSRLPTRLTEPRDSGNESETANVVLGTRR